jgi:energy-coupling factor transporter ATP-binding protein EcfA2
VQRVSVIGTSGSGKSTLARSLAGILDASWLELDSVYHQAGWTPLDASEFRARVVAAVAGRVELWNGNRERWRNLFTWDKEESVIAWAWQTYGSRRERYAGLLADPARAHLRVVRLTSPGAVRRFLRSTSGVD